MLAPSYGQHEIMDLGAANVLLAVGGGLASVFSPCVLPVILWSLQVLNLATVSKVKKRSRIFSLHAPVNVLSINR